MRLERVGRRHGLRGRWILREVGLDLPAGALVRVVGTNGTGKSTLLRLVAGVDAPTEGRVTGRPPRTAYVPERFPVALPFTAADYLVHLGRIRGGCTARLVAADLEAERPWFATQYVPGPSLHDRVAEEGGLRAADVASIGAALSEGLVAVHEAGVVHRDLKPSNILLSPKGPRIIDFGIAWATGASTLTHVGTAVGSPGFLAPEQVRGAAVTPATDVFSLGATLAYAAMSDSPFGHGSSEVMLYRVVHEEPQLHGVPDALAPLIRACLAKDPEDRPSTLQLSMRLKEIAAREAQGLPVSRPPVQRERAGSDERCPLGQRRRCPVDHEDGNVRGGVSRGRSGNPRLGW